MARRRTRYSKRERAKMIRLFLGGVTYKEIKRRTGWSRYIVKNTVSDAGISPKRGVTDAQAKQAINMYRNGATQDAIAEAIHHAQSTVKEILLNSSVKIRSLSGAHLLSKSGNMEWHKLSFVPRTTTRIISIPAGLLAEMGFNVGRPLWGRWRPRGKKLVLEVRACKPKRTFRGEEGRDK